MRADSFTALCVKSVLCLCVVTCLPCWRIGRYQICLTYVQYFGTSRTKLVSGRNRPSVRRPEFVSAMKCSPNHPFSKEHWPRMTYWLPDCLSMDGCSTWQKEHLSAERKDHLFACQVCNWFSLCSSKTWQICRGPHEASLPLWHFKTVNIHVIYIHIRYIDVNILNKKMPKGCQKDSQIEVVTWGAPHAGGTTEEELYGVVKVLNVSNVLRMPHLAFVDANNHM